MDDKFLETLRGPSRFLGNEINAVAKDPALAQARAVLTFPDVYDLGMSHLGFKIVYDALNAVEGIACERAFTPEPELEARLREEGRGLTSLESGLPLKNFDVLGISLPHEMAVTNVLTLLDLGGLSLKAAERAEDEPIVLAGGPAAFSCEPLAPFLDLVLLGDGEEAAGELVLAIGRARRAGQSRAEILARAARRPGVYVPSFYEPEYNARGKLKRMRVRSGALERVIKATVPDLDAVRFPTAPLVAFGKPIHDRLSMELARGCTRGCRFCQAGVIYRPVRERSPDRIFQNTLTSLKNTGYDEMSLLALSAGDYSCLGPLLTALMDRLGPERVSLSLPSLRVDTLDRAVAEQIRRVRATGFTLAPEAGSDRLRAVINKNITEQEILAAAQTAHQAGWKQLKLYFMIGLPTETEEDLTALAELAAKIAAQNRGLSVSVALSPFVPKPHTPFQWAAQLSAEEAWERIQFIRQALKTNRAIKVKWNSPEVAGLEGLLSRGDRRLAPVVERAWRAGARFEAWSEFFNRQPWADALAAEGLEAADYLAARELDQVLPWDHLNVADKDFLAEELKKALAGQQSGDCRHGGCLGCGVCDFESIEPRTVEGQSMAPPEPVPVLPAKRRIGLHYRKLGPARLFGHLEMASLLQRAFRRAGVSLAYSQGFHPQPKLSFFEALPVGFESLDEYALAEIMDPRGGEKLLRALDEQLPEGLSVTRISEEATKRRPGGALYRVSLSASKPPSGPELEQAAAAFLAQDRVPFERARPKKIQKLDLRRPVKELSLVHDRELEMVIEQAAQGPTPRPDEVTGYLLSGLGLEGVDIRVLKLKTVFED